MPQLACAKYSIHKQGGLNTRGLNGRDGLNENEARGREGNLLSTIMCNAGVVFFQCAFQQISETRKLNTGGRVCERVRDSKGMKEEGAKRLHSSLIDERECLSGNVLTMSCMYEVVKSL